MLLVYLISLQTHICEAKNQFQRNVTVTIICILAISVRYGICSHRSKAKASSEKAGYCGVKIYVLYLKCGKN